MKTRVASNTHSRNSVIGALTLGAMVTANSASAAVPTEITDAITAVGVDAIAVVTAGIVAWTAFKGLMVVWKVARRVLGMSTSG